MVCGAVVVVLVVVVGEGRAESELGCLSFGMQLLYGCVHGC
jgi:hypothetical protein